MEDTVILQNYYGKRVDIISKSNVLFSGPVIDYCFPEDSESGKESIIIKTDDGTAVEFDESDIGEIMIVQG
jgi:hypothetical protein